MCIRFDKVEGFIKVYDWIRYLVLYHAIYSRIKYLVRQKNGITYVFSLNYAKIKMDSYNYLPVEKTVSFYKVIVFSKSVLGKDELFLER